MAQKLVQTQALQQVQTLSPQQVLQVRLLEMPISELEQRVQTEMIDNGALEESFTDDSTLDQADYDASSDDTRDDQGEMMSEEDASRERALEGDDYRSPQMQEALGDYRSEDDVPDYLWQQGSDSRGETVSMDYGQRISFYEQMMQQMSEQELSSREQEVMTYLIGSLETDGLLKKKLSTIAYELEVYNNLDVTGEELESVLKKLQRFDPPGIAARSLQECLLIQIRRGPLAKSATGHLCIQVVERYWDDFTHRRWDKIAARLHLSRAEAERVEHELCHLNPRPGSAMGEVEGHNLQHVVPDFIVTTDENNQVSFTLNQGEMPQLRISPSFMALLNEADAAKNKLSRSERDALQYTRQKIDKAQGFIEAVRQRRHTLRLVMQAIIDLQYPFFVEGDESLLKPMILKDVATRTGLDISTVSRAANSKYADTPYGVYSLKWFFSDGYVTEDGEQIATRKIQAALKEIVEAEDKKAPYSDETLAAMLNQKGFPIARRTVAKYREQLGIPVARLRR